MEDSQIPTRAQLVEMLRTGGADAAARLRALPEERFAEGRYENGWNARQILAHVASAEWTYPGLIGMARKLAEEAAAGRQVDESEVAGISHAAIDDYNNRQVSKRAGATIEELIAEFETNRVATIAAVESVDESLLGMPARAVGGTSGPLGAVIESIAVGHVRDHVADIAGDRTTS